VTGITYVWTSPFDPLSNGKLGRWHGSPNRESVRPSAPGSLDEARIRIVSYVDHDNNVWLHSSLSDVTPMDKPVGLDTAIFAERDRKLEAARETRQRSRQGAERSNESVAGRSLAWNPGIVDIA